MQNFDYYNPTHIVFGQDRLAELNNLVPQNAKVLVLYGGGSVKRFGTMDKVLCNLGDRNVLEFGGIEPNPQFETLMKAVEIVRAEKIDFLLAVGGGSVMDGTKFIAAAAPYEGNAADLLTHGFGALPISTSIPLGTVATLPATGSEMNKGAVVSYNGGKYPVMSVLNYPKFSILDPSVTFTLPKTQVANGVVDAFVHILEQYVTYPTNTPVQDRTAEGLLKTLIEVGPVTLAEPENYEARSSLVWCATWALNGFIGSGVPQDWTTHMIGHELTALFGIDHAQSLAVIQPSVWKLRKDKKHAKLLQYAEQVWDIREGNDDERIDTAIAKTRKFFESLGVKTRLSEYDVTRDQIDDIVSALEKHGMTGLSETGDLTLDISRKIIEDAYS
ncbi:NADH-dependent alcohol dehydrogenase [Gammaproteobacteria bacterium 42_54_T18]|nr:NADH-dependent alcohol dehydrogenase [Gammaproteobacteria bacterium 42_54_T18]